MVFYETNGDSTYDHAAICVKVENGKPYVCAHSNASYTSYWTMGYTYAVVKMGGTIDTEPPTISNVQITDVSPSGYTVTCNVSDNVGVTSVKFPTWTDNRDGNGNDQDDLIWHEGTISGNTASCRINVSDHGGEVNCIYYTHIYAYDATGKYDWFGTSVYIDTNEYYLDINGILDGVTAWDIDGYGTADVYINNVSVADNVSDYLDDWLSGSSYELKDIQPLPGYSYEGISSGERKGTIGHANVEVWLVFSKIDPSSVTETPVEVEYNDHLYLYYPNTKVTWYAAKEICESLGGHLITITSEEENQFATSLISGNGHAWIGATDVRDEDNWKWITGETFDYAPWCPGEPNNSPPDDAGMDSQDYGVLYDGYGQWDDAAGTAKLGFICEIDTICDHSYIYEVSADPTETTAGLITGTCEYCDNTVEITLPALNKTDYSYSVLEEPTCQATGTGRYTWKNTAYGEFTFDVTLDKAEHSYEETVTPATCTQLAMKVYTCSVCGDSYSVPNDPEYSAWSAEYPDGVQEDLIESRTEYRCQTKETTTSDSDYLEGWTLYDTTTSWSDYGAWSKEWQFDPVTPDDYTMVATQTVYPYYYFYCTTCGTGARYPYYGGTCEICGNATIPSSTGTVVWYTNPWSDSTQWGNTSKYYQYIDGSIVWNWTDGSPQTQYKYCTRYQIYTYHHYRWSDWSEWGSTVYTANENRNVENRIAYRYANGPFGEHIWDDGIVTNPATCAATGTVTFTCSICSATKIESVTALGHNYVNGICTRCGEKEISIVFAYPVLNEDFNLVYAARVPANAADPYMVFTYQGREYTVSDYTVNDNGQYCFEFARINPQCMGDTISAVLHAELNGKDVTDTVAGYSARQYCVNMLNKTNDVSLKTLLSDLLTYGAAAQTYTGYRTNNLVTAGLDLTPSSFTAVSGKTAAFGGTADAAADWISAGLILGSNVTMRFTFAAESTEDLTVCVDINGREEIFDADDFTAVGSGKYCVDFQGIEANEFDDDVTAIFYRGGKTIGRMVSYTVNAYVCSTQNSSDANLQALVRALYNYGASAALFASSSEG